MQQQQAYEALALSNRLRDTRAHSPPTVEHRATPMQQQEEGEELNTGIKKQRVLSVREMVSDTILTTDFIMIIIIIVVVIIITIITI